MKVIASPVDSPASFPHTDRLPEGVWPVMLTPFIAGGKIDEAAYDHLLAYYEQGGAVGLFAACGSSEIEALSMDEIVWLSTRAVERSSLPVVGGAIWSGPKEEQVELAQRVANTGVRCVVLSTNQFVEEHEPEEVLYDRILEFTETIGGVQWGLYEYPVPRRRALSAQLLGALAQTGRFLFFKDTSADINVMKPKIRAVAGTPLQIYNAHAPTLRASLQGGAHGYSGTGGNFFMEPYVWMCRNAGTSLEGEASRSMQRFIDDALPVVRSAYPRGAKRFLQMRGVRLEETCRVSVPMYDPNELERLLEAYQRLKDSFFSPHS